MAILYIEPTPGNGKGYLDQTYRALKAQNYQVEVVGHGYPPIFIWEGNRTEVERIAKGIDENVRILDKHRTGHDDTAELSSPQPHEERQKPPPPKPGPEDSKPKGNTVDKKTLFDTLLKYYAEDEIRVFCHPLSIDYDDLPGKGKAIKYEQLVDLLAKRDKIDEFVEQVRKRDSNAFKFPP